MLVPDSSIRWVCFMPSEPVMPWTMTLESAVRKIAMVCRALFALGGQLPAASSAALRAAPSMVSTDA